jgi:hypothetical protein
MDKAKRAQTAETLKQPSLRLTLRAPYLYPDQLFYGLTGVGFEDHGYQAVVIDYVKICQGHIVSFVRIITTEGASSRKRITSCEPRVWGTASLKCIVNAFALIKSA